MQIGCSMHWSSFSEFWAMGGYAVYVWGSFGLTALAMVAEACLVRHRRQALMRELRTDADGCVGVDGRTECGERCINAQRP